MLRTLLAAAGHLAAADDTPYPFERALQSGDSGKDVTILQALLARPGASIEVGSLSQSGSFDDATAAAVQNFRQAKGLGSDAKFDTATAKALVECCLEDGYKDDGLPARHYGKLYKVHVPVHKDRHVETWGTLYDADNNELLRFKARAKGQGTRNQLTSNGDTPTGLIEFDFNSPEPDPQVFGPYPINRAVCAKKVEGLQTNAEIVLGVNRPKASMRVGILLHTGNYSRNPGWEHWAPPMDMPDSEGCIHSYWENISSIAEALKKLGVDERPNPYGKQPYPYEPQGLLSVELIDSLGAIVV